MGTMTEENILARHAERVALLRERGPLLSQPDDLIELHEQHRRDWMAFYNQDEGEPRTRRDTGERLRSWLADKVGWAVTTDQLAEAAGKTVETARRWARDTPGVLRAAPGQDDVWFVRDPNADRIVAKNAKTAEAAINTLTGH